MIETWNISAEEKRALRDYGLPRAVPPFFECTLQPDSGPVVPSTSLGMLYRLGWDLGAHVAVAEGAAGVYAVAAVADGPDVFVNSSLTHFIECIFCAGRVRRDFARLDGASIDRAGAQLRAELAALDPAAFAVAGYWWPMVCEQIEAGTV